MTADTKERAALRCPFCGHDDTGELENSPHRKWIICDNCGAQGPRASDPVGAWNRRAPTAVPAGMVLVPREPTPEMLEAASHAFDGKSYPQDWVHGPRQMDKDKYRAMIAASQAEPGAQP